jgi:PAS domain-containing protein
MREAVIVADPQFQILMINKEAEHIFEVDPEQSIGKSV